MCSNIPFEFKGCRLPSFLHHRHPSAPRRHHHHHQYVQEIDGILIRTMFILNLTNPKFVTLFQWRFSNTMHRHYIVPLYHVTFVVPPTKICIVLKHPYLSTHK